MKDEAKKQIKRFLALALGLVLALQTAPSAQAQTGGTEEPPPAAEEPGNDPRAAENALTVLDGEELQALAEQALKDLGLKAENVSIGYCYTPTGETWYFNEDAWYYSASLYKVPLMMIMAEREKSGELTQESVLTGRLTLAYAEDRVLVYSNNEIAHTVMGYLGSDREVREMYKQYSTLPEEDYPKNFLVYSYFSPRFMTDVMMTLYYEQERFPNILDCLKKAQPDGWFNKTGNHEYEIAQKYGAYEEVHHTSGVVYTPEPFILTVMTKNSGYPEESIGKIKQRFQDYTLQLAPRLEQAREEREALEEQERQKAEEARRMAEAEALASPEPVETPAPETTVSVEPAVSRTAPSPSPTPAPEQEARRQVLWIGGAVALGLCLAAVGIAAAGRKRGRRSALSSGGGKHYTPRH